MRYLGIDTGGTNVRVYEVDEKTGNLDNENPLLRIKTEEIKDNSHLTRLILDTVKKAGNPGKVIIGATSAGVVDEQRLVVLGSPNFPTIRGEITYASDLRAVGYDVTQTNDMKGALLGIVKYGQGKGLENVLVATFSSGHNYAVWENGKITTRVIEAGHESYKLGAGVFCGCGGEGHLEPYVSGNGAKTMAIQALLMLGVPYHTILEETIDPSDEKIAEKITKLKTERDYRFKKLLDIDARAVYSAWRKKPDENPQRDIRDIQVQAIAVSIGHMMSHFGNLDLMCMMGSQTKDWEVLFEPALDLLREKPENYALGKLKLPDIKRNDQKKVGVIGAVAYNLYQKGLI